MHDLLRSLAQHIIQDECFVGDAQAFENKYRRSDSSSLTKLRRLSIVDGELEKIPDSLMEQTSLRTLSFFDTPRIHDLPQDLFRKLRRLRVLNLSRTAINKLPNSLGDLVQLRCLDLSYTQIKEIPESIGNLINIQFLVLEDCNYLQSLHISVLRLLSLRFLNIQGVPLDGLPMGIGSLPQLNTLLGFVVNGSEARKSGGDDREQEHQHRSFCTLEELKSLSQLRNISIYKLERVSDRAEARDATLKAKPHLKDLILRCTLSSSSSDVHQPRPNNYKEEDIKRIEEVFEELCPPPCLEQLEINGYFGREFPSWMISKAEHSSLSEDLGKTGVASLREGKNVATPFSSLLSKLRRLALENCTLCKQLPSLGVPQQLDYLKISGAYAVTRIGPEFFSSLPKLEQLVFQDMPNWEEWSWEEKDDHTTSLLPSLNKLTIDKCPKLRYLPKSLRGHATALERLHIGSSHSSQPEREIQSIPSLT